MSESKDDDARNEDHELVLKRLGEVASTKYPYPIPERVRLEKSQRINLTSRRNLRPLLSSLFFSTINMACPPLTLLLLVLGWLCTSKVCIALAVICFFRTLVDTFVLHYATDGRHGGLGGGGKCKTTGLPNSTAAEGFYCNAKNELNARIRDRLGRFVNYVPTPYFYSGDLLTLGPFLLFKGSKGGRVGYKRYWVKVPSAPAPDGDGPSKKPPSPGSKDEQETDGGEAVALDIVFPESGYQPDKPFFLVMHGLNGGSTEPYVLDLARRAPKEGHTVAVMINRGLMKTPVQGPDTFHGARTSDVGCVVDALNHALYGQSRFQNSSGDSDNEKTKSKIVLVGFSMGGIIVANYAAKSKENSGLAGALSFSGGICMAKNLLDCPAARHSASVWQPALAWGLKASIIKPSMAKFVQRGVTVQDVEEVQSVVDIDGKLVCKYHGYKTIYDYYEDMSAGGLGDEKGLKRLEGTKIPLLSVHAIDDPISIYETMLADEVSRTDNVMLLATKHGGHIGWPNGLFPSENRWDFMINIAMEYAFEVAS
mmetsp:Transcript_17008/g.38835  ORF Transcript_17008/g.38835 Transcript_17008/m.38835 type:complete len:538 (-) Transcript_17008:47-1660(-)|eukprot:CAMPEP_0201125792 /NCGR_PEP_ID=MMETSP0850-20130426/23115_1 /ASSEMBLY_ACC=CAM_ASM_000622 /TAXON_ID=183588 /ORGANISM="Pseudo-nitzschia fraudulenta, Strain WWA7" /LENGTH=537 /DNA_ID=CAMNT_0047393947 /DNA_START=71 /DNA_END=1684 /DNA_ORIENTATION=-